MSNNRKWYYQLNEDKGYYVCSYEELPKFIDLYGHKINNITLRNEWTSSTIPTKNIDKIRQMTADELAKLIGNIECKYCPADKLCNTMSDSCQNIIKQWLEQEVEE